MAMEDQTVRRPRRTDNARPEPQVMLDPRDVRRYQRREGERRRKGVVAALRYGGVAAVLVAAAAVYWNFDRSRDLL